MLLFTAAFAAWTSLGNQKWHNNLITYSIEEGFCDNMLRKLLEDRILSFNSINCDDVQFSLRRAFSAWEYNSDKLKFKQVKENRSHIANIQIKYDDVNRENVLGTATNWRASNDQLQHSIISIDDSYCWYLDNVFCHGINRFADEHNWFLQVFKALWVTCLGVILSLQVHNLCYKKSIFAIQSKALLIFSTWFLTLLPLLFWGVIFPCTKCYDFNILMTHEIGHALGFNHTDAENNQCGCANASRCAPSLDSILVSKIHSRSNACLSQSDVDGLHKKYEEPCKPVVCFPSASESYIGYIRGTIAFVLPILISLIMTVLVFYTERRTSRF